MKVYKVWAKPPGRAAHPMLEIEPNQNAGRWAVYVYSKGTRRFFEWVDDQHLAELLERHRTNGNTVELSEKGPEFRWR
jgi:hypothetical protein